MTFVVYMTEEQRAEWKTYCDDVRSGRITPELIPTEIPPDTRTEEEKQADDDAFVAEMIKHMEKAIDDEGASAFV